MKRNQPTLIAAGLGGAVLIASLAFGVTAATAQDNDDTPWNDWEDHTGRPPLGAHRFGGPGVGDDLADELGMTTDELAAAFESGQTLPEIAEAAGVDLDALFDDRRDEALASIEERVASGELTQEQAERITERIEGFANGETPWGDGPPPWAGDGAPWGDGPPPWDGDDATDA